LAQGSDQHRRHRSRQHRRHVRVWRVDALCRRRGPHGAECTAAARKPRQRERWSGVSAVALEWTASACESARHWCSEASGNTPHPRFPSAEATSRLLLSSPFCPSPLCPRALRIAGMRHRAAVRGFVRTALDWLTRRSSRTPQPNTHAHTQSAAHDNLHAAVWRGASDTSPREARVAAIAAAPVLRCIRFCSEPQSRAAQGCQRDHIATKCNDHRKTFGACATDDVHGRSVSMGALLRPLQQCRIRRSRRPLEVSTQQHAHTEGRSKEGAEGMASCALAVVRSLDRACAVADAGTVCGSLFFSSFVSAQVQGGFGEGRETRSGHGGM
jgi:hypothetical protein